MRRLCCVVADQVIGKGRAHHALDGEELVARGVAAHGFGAVEVDMHPSRGAAVARYVEPALPIAGPHPCRLEQVVAVVADGRVVAAEPEDLIGEIGAVQVVVGVGAGDGGHVKSPYGLLERRGVSTPNNWVPGEPRQGRGWAGSRVRSVCHQTLPI